MDKTEAEFRAWRLGQRHRLICTWAIGATALCLALVVAEILRWAHGHALGGDSRPSPAATQPVVPVSAPREWIPPELSWDRAVRVVAQELPEIPIPEGPGAHLTPEYTVARARDAFVLGLSAGLALVGDRHCHDLARRVAHGLTPRQRHDWLWAAFLESLGAGAHDRLATKAAAATGDPNFGAWLDLRPQTVWEGVYNLTDEPELALLARVHYDEWANQQYARAATLYAQALVDYPRTIPSAPRLATMPSWPSEE